MSHKVTLADVSRELGLGIATVSRALAAEPHPDVSHATRERVRAAADRLGYRPSVTARALRSGGFRAISLVLPDDTWGWWEPAVRECFLEAAEQGYQVLVHPVAGRAGGAAAVVESLANVPTEGVVLFGSANDQDVVRAAQQLRLHVVTIDDVSEEVAFPTVCVDNEAGARAATSLLLRRGRSRVAYVGTADTSTTFARAWLAGYQRALRDHDVTFDPDLVVACADPLDESVTAHPEVERFLARGTAFDAVFCEFDLLAAPVLRSLRAAGRRVPEDVAIVGFDDERAAQLLHPQLTTVRQPYREMGQRAVDLLLRAMRGEELEVARQLVAPSLVERSST